jgi:hypothetical protein
LIYGQEEGAQIRISRLSDGGNVSVTNENKAEYVELYVEWVLNTSVEEHFRAFKHGFLKVWPMLMMHSTDSVLHTRAVHP